MKNVHKAILTLLLGSSSVIFAQENVGIGTKFPDNSAVLDIQAVDKGLLIPRLSVEQRNLIKTPANGLLVYQTNEKSGFYFFNGEFWKPLSENDSKSVSTLDINGWALNGNASATANNAAATSASFIGVPTSVPLNFKIGSTQAGIIDYDVNIGKTFFGFGAGKLSSVTGNTGFGYEVLTNTTTGNFNTALGFLALRLNSTGTQNVAIGGHALYSNNGDANVAIGKSALYNNSTGDNNFALGFWSQKSNVSGNNNISIGSYTLEQNLGSNNTAIGTTAGYNKNGSGNLFLGFEAGRSGTLVSESNKLYISNSNATNPLIKGDFAANNLQINSKTTGYLAIGDFTSATSATPGAGGLPLPANIGAANGYRLVVQDGILCEKVKVALRATGSADWADYVFEPEYKAKMLSLEEVEAFTLKNKHLPNVPTTAEVQKNGLDMHETSRMFMEKIEELTLYMIELNKEVKALKAENAALKGNK
jgi:hypothetical protein